MGDAYSGGKEVNTEQEKAQEFLRLSLSSHTGFIPKYENTSFLGSIPFYEESGKDIIAYEYLLGKGEDVYGTIYEVLKPEITFQSDRTWFFVPDFCVSCELASRASGTVNQYFHSGKVRRISDNTFFFLDGGLGNSLPIAQYDNFTHSLQKIADTYFTSGSYLRKNLLIADPRSHRVYAPMPGSIVTYEEFQSHETPVTIIK